MRNIWIQNIGDFLGGFSIRADEMNTNSTSKMHSDCQQLAKNSYKCLEENQSDPNLCAKHFEVYKECRKAEHTRIVEERRKKGVTLS
jgi:hypothetical protein